MERNNFIKSASLLTAGGLILPELMLAGEPGLTHFKKLKKIGVQLFSVPAGLEKDFEVTITSLAYMGFKEIELFGPYPYSAQSAKDRWAAITPMLGFSGSGYFGKSEAYVKSIFDANGLTVPAIHTDLDTLEQNMESLGKAARVLGFEYVILPAIPEERRTSLDDYKKMADTFNTIGAAAKNVGIKFAYHNHGYGLSEVKGQIPLRLILDYTDPELVFLEMDLFWTIAGRADPIQYLKKYSGRYRSMHVKDMKEIKHFSGDGGDTSQWIALFPNMTSAGEGVVDLKAIIAAALKNGVEHFFVEQDMVQNPEVALKKSFKNLSAL